MNRYEAPDFRAALAAGLAWIYETEQPDDAIPAIHGYSTQVADRILRFIGAGYEGRPVVVVDVAEPVYAHPGPSADLLNPLGGAAEMDALAAAIRAAGREVGHWWNGMGTTGSVGLATPAHPSLLAGLRRYSAQCPTHRSVFCSANGCTWLRDGLRRTAQPAWPTPQPEGVDSHA